MFKRVWVVLVLSMAIPVLFFAGCAEEKECMSNYDCPSGQVCVDYQCVSPPQGGTQGTKPDIGGDYDLPPGSDIEPISETPNCDDNNECTYDYFDGNKCVHKPLGPEFACTTQEGRPGHCPPESQCTEESCECVPDRINCDDGLDCTHDYADVQGACHHDVLPGTCLIDGKCYNNGDANPQNTCLVCDAETEQTDWTTAPEGTTCDDGDPNTINDACNANGECVGQTAECSTDDQCDDGLDCTTDSCVDGSCNHQILADYCLIDGTCYNNGDANPQNTCLVCDAETEQTDWTTAPEGTTCDDGDPNTINDTCNANGECVGQTAECSTDDQCDDGLDCTTDSCVDGICENTLQNGWCLIDGACIADGEANPDNECEACQTDTDAYSWTPKPQGTTCDDGNINTVNDTCDGAGNCAGEIIECSDDTQCTSNYDCLVGTCINNTCEFSVVDFKCFIDGVCYNENASNPDNICQACLPSINQTEWSNADGVSCDDGEVCTVNDVCQNGQCVGEWVEGCCTDDAQCDDGLDCTEDYCASDVNTCVNEVQDGFCVIDNQCVENGTQNPDNFCQACNATENQYGWSPANEGEPCDPDDASKVCVNGACVIPWQCTDDNYEDNDNYLNATEIEFNNLYDNLQICQNDNGGDWYKFTLATDCSQTITVNVNFAHSEGDINVIVYTVDNSQLIEVGSGMSMDDNETVELNNLTAGDYYIYVSLYVQQGQDLDGNSYSLEVVVPDECAVECTDDTQCDDGFACTVDACIDGMCQNTIAENYCLIDGACYEDGAENPNNYCLACITAASQTEWSYAHEGETCDDNKICHLGECVNDTNECLPDQFEPNDDFDSATQIELNRRYTGLIACPTDDDYYKVTLYECEEPAIINIYFIDALGDLDLHLYNSDGTVLAYAISSDDNEQITYTVNSTGVYYIKVDMFTQTVVRNAYELEVLQPESCLPTPCETDAECDDGIVCTTDLCIGGTCQHSITDGFCFIDGTCYESGTQHPDNFCLACDPAQSQEDWSPANEGQDCGEGMRCENGECVEYCVDDQYEDNDTADEAKYADSDQEYNAHVCPNDDDWYFFEVPAGCVGRPVKIDILFSHDEGDIDAYVYKGDDLSSYIANGTSASDNEQITFIPDDSNVNYYLKIKLYRDYGNILGNDYTFIIDVCLPLPVNIYDIQNPDSENHPAENTKVQVSGAIVASEVFTVSTRYNLDGFFVADPQGGAWNGIFVIFNTNNLTVDVQPGDEITLVGTYKEYYDLSEIDLESYEVTGTGTVPDPVVIDDPCSIATGGADAEAYEGVLVEVHNVSVSQEANQYDEFEVANCLLVDDLIYDYTNPALGTTYSVLRGFLHYSYSNYKLLPRSADDMVEESGTGGGEVGGTVNGWQDWRTINGLEGITVDLLQNGNVVYSTQTDATGHYTITGVAGGDYVIRFSADFITENSHAITIPDGASILFDITVLLRDYGNTYDPTTTITHRGSTGFVQVEIPPNGFQTEDGSAPTGNITVRVSDFDVNYPPNLAMAPGDFIGTDGNSETLIETRGMAEIVATDEAGNKLQLADGVQATIRFNITYINDNNLNDGDTIPMWWFDTENGVWVREGEATVQTDTNTGEKFAVGQVSHFTWWNIDIPISQQDCISGTVSNLQSETLSGARVILWSDSHQAVVSTTTDADGNFCLSYYRNADVEVMAIGRTSDGSGPRPSILYTYTLPDNGSSCRDENLQCLNADLPLLDETCVSGVVKNANGETVANANIYAVAANPVNSPVYHNFIWHATTGTDGSFCLVVPGGLYDAVSQSLSEYELRLNIISEQGYAITTTTVQPGRSSCGNCQNDLGDITVEAGSATGDGCATGRAMTFDFINRRQKPAAFTRVLAYVAGSVDEMQIWDVCYGSVSPNQIGDFLSETKTNYNGEFHIENLPIGVDVSLIVCFENNECGPLLSEPQTIPETDCADFGELRSSWCI